MKTFVIRGWYKPFNQHIAAETSIDALQTVIKREPERFENMRIYNNRYLVSNTHGRIEYDCYLYEPLN